VLARWKPRYGVWQARQALRRRQGGPGRP